MKDLRSSVSATLKSRDLHVLALKFFAFFVGVSLITFLVLLIVHPSLNSILTDISKSKSGTEDMTGFALMIEYFVNNAFKVNFQMFYLSLILVPFIYLLPIILTSALTGAVFYFPIVLPKLSFATLAAGFSIHWILELLGYCIFIAALYPFQKILRKQFFNLFKHKASLSALKTPAINLLTVYVFAVVPIMLVAAALEAFVSSRL
ncbi:stage II sporulation protein M [Companilactobacillus mishanensis]|uniref:Stage II sporulation protein M n=1 Tax=Companilactobacillus mishanensis TaxID=2486008 RepID=A0A5P0ZL07_9LACO|nr:stage II sporulation protein M [Companilactobacillus mishanensis]MQS45520.1 stage II sporulation protein M [Companilactobacillus mishanensis]MQS53357.1 stage II sporulation protein M [Companilactobacillus mishanensis]